MPIKGTYYNATLGAAPTAVSSGTNTPYLGSIVSSNVVTSALGDGYFASSVIVNTPGIYIISFLAIGTSGNTGTYGKLYMNGGINLSGALVRSDTTTSYYCSGTTIQSISANTYNLILSYAAGSAGLLTLSSGSLIFCRIG